MVNNCPYRYKTSTNPREPGLLESIFILMTLLTGVIGILAGFTGVSLMIYLGFKMFL